MKYKKYIFCCLISTLSLSQMAIAQVLPDEIKFVRQASHRMIFDSDQSIPLASLEPEKIVGLSAMHPITYYSKDSTNIYIDQNKLIAQSDDNSEASIWLGGFNPFATYSVDIAASTGKGQIGFEFAAPKKEVQFFITVEYRDTLLTNVKLKVVKNDETIVLKSIRVNISEQETLPNRIILQMLGSGLVLYAQNVGLPKVIAQNDFNKYYDLRKKQCIHTFHSNLFVALNKGKISIKRAEINFSTGVGLSDIRAITYEDGSPLIDQGRLWYTMSIRGRALPHHIQGVFSMNPTVFDLKLEGIILFDRNDGIFRNEIASHIFYDRNDKLWKGLTTGFSAYANPDIEKKQLLAVQSIIDPRFGFSVMDAKPFGIVGDIEDPHILFDQDANKWRILTCENHNGYKAVIMESDYWNKDFSTIAGPVEHNSTGTSIQKINKQFYCFSGSSEREIYIYTYPELKEAGTLKMDLPPWDEKSGTRVWPNVVQLPEGYPFRYVALMMDRFNYPGMNGPNWTYGALYLYYGYDN